MTTLTAAWQFLIHRTEIDRDTGGVSPHRGRVPFVGRGPELAGERTRLSGSPEPDVWAAAMNAAHELSLEYLAAYSEARLAEAIVRSGG